MKKNNNYERANKVKQLATRQALEDLKEDKYNVYDLVEQIDIVSGYDTLELTTYLFHYFKTGMKNGVDFCSDEISQMHQLIVKRAVLDMTELDLPEED